MEENKKSYLESDFVQNFLNVYTANGGSKTRDEMLSRTVGSNGDEVGARFTLDGKIHIKENTINGVKQTYIILSTKEGKELSLMSLMGVSSLTGYIFTGSVPTQHLDDANAVIDSVVNPTAGRTIKVSETWQPPTRNLLTLAGMIAEGDLDLTGKVVTYLGTAAKPYTAKKDGTDLSGENYRSGMLRAIVTKLWSVR